MTTTVASALQWRNGIGYLDAGANPEALYDLSYFNRCAKREDTKIGRLLVAKRVELVNRFCKNEFVCDVGIGAGAFIRCRGGETKGFDVNPLARAWLNDHGLWCNAQLVQVDNATMFDSLEHMTSPSAILPNIMDYAFVSTPIYRDKDHCLRSKHMKPGEHVLYFTEEGLLRFMSNYSFSLIESTDYECRLGREDVKTFVFKRSVV